MSIELEWDDDEKTPVKEAGWQRATLNSPAFARLADDLAERLDRLTSPQARMRADECRLLAEAFKLWRQFPPTDEERHRTINALIDANRCALDLLAGSR